MTKLLNQLNITNIINDETLSIRLALENVKRILCVKDAENWNKSLADSEKLRTYRKYKTVLKKGGYCDLPLPRDHRRILFKLRSCSLPLALETGRYSKPKTPVNERLCKFCNSSSVEDETHFLINCELYSDIRLPLFQKAGEHNENFNTLIAEDKLIFIMQNKDLQFLLGSTLSNVC